MESLETKNEKVIEEQKKEINDLKNVIIIKNILNTKNNNTIIKN